MFWGASWFSTGVGRRRACGWVAILFYDLFLIFLFFLSKIGGGVNGGEVLVLVVLVVLVDVEYAEPRLILVRALVQILVQTLVKT